MGSSDSRTFFENKTPTMILHTVVFRLKHPAGSEAELHFLRAAKKLAELPDVSDFHVYRQVGKKNDFAFGLSMTFARQEHYDAYNEHPAHVHFVKELWLKQVEDFMEIDYVEHSI